MQLLFGVADPFEGTVLSGTDFVHEGLDGVEHGLDGLQGSELLRANLHWLAAHAFLPLESFLENVQVPPLFLQFALAQAQGPVFALAALGIK